MHVVLDQKDSSEAMAALGGLYRGKKNPRVTLEKYLHNNVFKKLGKEEKGKREQFQGLEVKSNIAVNKKKWVNSPVVEEKWVNPE